MLCHASLFLNTQCSCLCAEGERYQKLLAVLQSVEKEKTRQAGAAQSLQERLSRAQEEISTLQTSITQRASHYQQLHNQLLDKAAQATTLEKEVIHQWSGPTQRLCASLYEVGHVK